jgi:hypothetical protein
MCSSIKPRNHSVTCKHTAHGLLSNESFNHLTIFGFRCLEFCSKFFCTFCCVLISMIASDWMAAVRVCECSYLFEETNLLTSPCPNVYSHWYREKLNREKWGEREKCSGIPSHSSPAVILSFNATRYLITKYPDWVHLSSTRNKLSPDSLWSGI